MGTSSEIGFSLGPLDGVAGSRSVHEPKPNSHAEGA